jgi:hypothetical protein
MASMSMDFSSTLSSISPQAFKFMVCMMPGGTRLLVLLVLLVPLAKGDAPQAMHHRPCAHVHMPRSATTAALNRVSRFPVC